MILQYASDLHLEFPENKAFLNLHPLKPKGEILILAGDIVPFILMDKYTDFFSFLSDNFKATYWIPGNHEYYQFDISTKSGLINEPIRSNVFLVNNTKLTIENVDFIFSTLWSKIKPEHERQLVHAMSDFRFIKNGQNPFSVEQLNELHTESVAFLSNELTKKGLNKKVVVTHHVPTFKNYPEKLKINILNEAFGVELSDMIEITQPDYWIYGHVHRNTPDIEIGKTKLLTNQMGYVKYGEEKLFKTNKTFSL